MLKVKPSQKSKISLALMALFVSSSAFAMELDHWWVSADWSKLPAGTEWVMNQTLPNGEKMIWAAGQNENQETWVVPVAAPSTGPGIQMEPGIWTRLRQQSEAEQIQQ